MLWYLSVCLSVCLCVCVYLDSSVWVKICTRISCWKLFMPAQKFCELLFFSSRFSKNMYFTRFFMHFSNMYFSWKKHHIWSDSAQIFCRRRDIKLLYWICTLKCPMTPFPRFCFVLKTWNFHCTRTYKNWKSMIFWIFSFVLILFSNNKIVRRTRFCRF